jgi:hypothetical protein
MQPDHVQPDSAATRTNQIPVVDQADAKDIRNNKALMYVSVVVTVASLLAFFWLAGVLDWRGSKGVYFVNIQFDCDKQEGPKTFDLIVLLDKEDARVAYRNLLIDLAKHDSCKTVRIISSPPITEVTGDNDKPISTTHRVIPSGDGSPSDQEELTFPFPKVGDFALHYKRRSLLEYTGLSERSIVMFVYCSLTKNDGSTDYGAGSVTTRPPDGFQIVESSWPGSLGNIESQWEANISATRIAPPPLRLRMRDDKLSRLDHILDSAVATLLGVGVGGIVNAYLALILLRRSHRHRPS